MAAHRMGLEAFMLPHEQSAGPNPLTPVLTPQVGHRERGSGWRNRESGETVSCCRFQPWRVAFSSHHSATILPEAAEGFDGTTLDILQSYLRRPSASSVRRPLHIHIANILDQLSWPDATPAGFASQKFVRVLLFAILGCPEPLSSALVGPPAQNHGLCQARETPRTCWIYQPNHSSSKVHFD